MKFFSTLKNVLIRSRSCKTLALVAAFLFMAGASKAQTVYALSGSTLISFSPSAPAAVTTVGAVTGIAAGQTVEGMDFRPATGQLFAMGYNSSNGATRLYVINLKSAVATPVGTADITLPTGLSNFGFDYNPTVDRIRVVNGVRNYRLNPNDGSIVVNNGMMNDGNLAYSSGSNTPNAVAAAYTNSYVGTGATVMYIYDYANNTIAASTNPNAGTLTPNTTGTTGITPASATGIDLDITYNMATATNSAYLLATVGSGSGLYSVNLATGAATSIGAIGASSVTEMAIYFPPAPVNKLVYALTGNTLIRFYSNTPGTTTNIGTISLAAGQSMVGLDFRPATGQLFGMSYNPTDGMEQLYTIDSTTAVATAVGSPQTLGLNLTRIGFDFNPVPDRIRVTASGGQNFRLNPDNGAIAATDSTLRYVAGDANAGTSPGVITVAYSNSIARAATTTMYAYDFTTRTFDSSNNPNAGQLRTVGAVSVIPNNADSVDMDISFNSATGTNMALLAISGTLYVINPLSGSAGLPVIMSSMGTIGTAGSTAVSDIAIYLAPPTLARTVYAISGTNLVSFPSNIPGTVTTIGATSGVTAGQTLVGLDFRPANGALYAYGYNATNGQGQLYTMSTTTGAATTVGSAITLPTGMSNIGFDFNPMADRIRLTSSTGLNYRLVPTDGTVGVMDPTLAYSTTTSDINSGVVPNIAAVAYTNSFNGTGSTTIYYYDYGTDVLVTAASPNTGVINTVGNSGILSLTGASVDMDIAYNAGNNTNTVFLTATIAGTGSNMYLVNNRTGELKLIGAIGTAGTVITEMAISGDVLLPITLAEFTGQKKGSSSILNWTTQTEINNDHFVIERSNDGIKFAPISNRIASKAPEGNSSQRLSYSYTDDAPAKGINYYRLLQVDKDGKSTASKIVSLRFEGGYNISLYPNPAISVININGNAPERADLQIRLSDLTGKTISNTVLKGQQGNWNTQIPASRLSAGTYYITILKDNMPIYTEAVQKK